MERLCSRPILSITAGGKIRGRFRKPVEAGADQTKLFEDGTENLLSRGGRRVEHFNSDLLDPQDVLGKASNLIGVKQKRIFLIAPVLRIQLARVEGRVEIAGIGVGVAVNRSP